MRYLKLICLLIIVFYSSLLMAYETQTHDNLSREAILNSVLRLDSELLPDLGLKAFDENEGFPSDVPRNERNPKPDDIIFLPEASITRILTGGSVLEDGNNRPLNHFFSVQTGGQPATVGGLPVLNARASPDWALELDQNGTRLDIPGQAFSYADAVDYFYAALTLEDEEE